MKLSVDRRKRWPGLTNPIRENAMASRIEENAYLYEPPTGAATDTEAAPCFIRDSEIQLSGLQRFYEGQRVSFDVVMGPDGELIAVNIKPI
ncbi:cold-shock protein [Ralstonia syzygii subsp. celebesensis]|nr:MULTISPECIES: cold shock domain-containing protein [Ralstonia solanacearum species complex]